jgi:hypothetical protein
MANSKLEDKTFVIPHHVIKTVKPGTMRSDFVLRRKDGLSYYNMKRLKNFYDTQIENDPDTYQALGEDLQKWVDSTLGTHRDSLHKGKKVKSDIGMLNVFKSAHSKNKGNGSHKVRLPKPQFNARQIFTGKGLYESEMNDNSEQITLSKNDAVILYDSKDCRIVVALSHKAVCAFAPDTILCKSSSNNPENWYKHQMAGVEFIIIHKDMDEDDPERVISFFMIWNGASDWFDNYDSEMSQSRVKELIKTYDYPMKDILKYFEKTKKEKMEEEEVIEVEDPSEVETFSMKENEKLDKLRYILDESLIQKYSLMIESPLYNNVEDIISDIMYFENKRKKYTK